MMIESKPCTIKPCIYDDLWYILYADQPAISMIIRPVLYDHPLRIADMASPWLHAPGPWLLALMVASSHQAVHNHRPTKEVPTCSLMRFVLFGPINFSLARKKCFKKIPPSPASGCLTGHSRRGTRGTATGRGRSTTTPSTTRPSSAPGSTQTPSP